MSKPISDLFTARVAFDERTDIAMSAADFRESKLPDLISKQYSPTWLAGRHACFHAALKAERARLAPINKAVAEVLKVAEPYANMHNRNCAIVDYSVCSCDVEKLHKALSALKAVLK